MRWRAVLVVSLTVVVGACGGGGPEPAPDTGPKTVIGWWDGLGGTPEVSAAVDAVIKRYEDEHRTVDVERKVFAADEFEQAVDQAAASGSLPDVLVLDHLDLPHRQAALADVTDGFGKLPFKDTLVDSARDAVTVAGRVRAVPFRLGTVGLVVNRDLVPTVPTTWDEVRDKARQAATTGKHGLCFAGTEAASTYLPLLWRDNGDLRDADASATALSYLDDLVTTGAAPKDLAGWSRADLEREFGAGRCAMMIDGPWSVPVLNQTGMTWQSGPLPQDSPSPLVGEVAAVSDRSAHRDVAWALLAWISGTRDNITQLGGVLGALPYQRDMIEDFAWQWDPNALGFSRQMPHTRAGTRYSDTFRDVTDILSATARQVLTGEAEPAGAAAQAVGAITPHLR
ncbi:hypothetical protein GCM10022243_55780 [Saccharothrix violaceirubra]|uniref:Multiple sugar transport system substrate-binding protein n=1 Tax=Saccharothrix violaceirubra TaxID=413306 RepID=A0A7W7T5R0_9PSEU|nr:extracellular solute-binding protein [Saccharothrix violaceirubra]MBB4967088.1 multiple sugar transport system substrate-binding protein [Saccharothrix violaceirubra]